MALHAEKQRNEEKHRLAAISAKIWRNSAKHISLIYKTKLKSVSAKEDEAKRTKSAKMAKKKKPGSRAARYFCQLAKRHQSDYY